MTTDPARVQGIMHLTALERSANGAVFAVLQNDMGHTFSMPIDDLYPTIQILFGSRNVKLKAHQYYGRTVYKFDLSRA